MWRRSCRSSPRCGSWPTHVDDCATFTPVAGTSRPRFVRRAWIGPLRTTPGFRSCVRPSLRGSGKSPPMAASSWPAVISGPQSCRTRRSRYSWMPRPRSEPRVGQYNVRRPTRARRIRSWPTFGVATPSIPTARLPRFVPHRTRSSATPMATVSRRRLGPSSARSERPPGGRRRLRLEEMAVGGKKLPFFPRATGAILRVAAACTTRVTVEGLENIPQSGPVLIICNHCSNADGMLLLAYVAPALGRPMGWLGKAEALRWPLFGWGMRQNGVFGVRRGSGDLEAFKLAKSVLDKGGVLTIFPEGTRSPSGAMQEAKEGASVLAVRSGAPILPIAIVGSQRFWAKGARLPRPGRWMSVRVGETFTLALPKGGDRHESLRLATVELMRHIAALLPPEQRGVYADSVK